MQQFSLKLDVSRLGGSRISWISLAWTRLLSLKLQILS